MPARKLNHVAERANVPLAWRGVALAAAAIGVLGLVAEHDAHGATVTYRDLSKRGEEVRAAVAAWNRAGLRVRFVKAKRGRRADLRFIDYRFADPFVAGEMAGDHIRLKRSAPREYGHPLLRSMGSTVVHEIGHYLGLRHPTTAKPCSVMHAANPAAQRNCPRTPDLAACGPQRYDVRAVARRHGWRKGARRALDQPSFGRCPIADGPNGARFTQNMCGPEHLELYDKDGTVRTGTLKLTTGGELWQPGIETYCTWTIPGRADDEPFIMFVDRTLLPVFRGETPSGNCRGDRAAGPGEAHSTTRYLSALAYGGPYQPADPTALAAAALTAAEAAGVGLACQDGPAGD